MLLEPIGLDETQRDVLGLFLDGFQPDPVVHKALRPNSLTTIAEYFADCRGTDTSAVQRNTAFAAGVLMRKYYNIQKDRVPEKAPKAMPDRRSLYDLTTEEAYYLAAEIAEDLPPLEAVENEDWGRDYVLQQFQQLTEAELLQLGLTWESLSDAPDEDNENE